MTATAMRSLTELLLDPTRPVSTITRRCVTLPLGTAASEGRSELLRHGATEMVVVDLDDRPVGLLRAEDLLVPEVPPASSGPSWPIPELDVETERHATRVEDLMQLVFVRMPETASIASACAAMARRRARLLVVVTDAGRLLGTLSADEIVRWSAGSALFENGIAPAPADEAG